LLVGFIREPRCGKTRRRVTVFTKHQLILQKP